MVSHGDIGRGLAASRTHIATGTVICAPTSAKNVVYAAARVVAHQPSLSPESSPSSASGSSMALAGLRSLTRLSIRLACRLPPLFACEDPLPRFEDPALECDGFGMDEKDIDAGAKLVHSSSTPTASIGKPCSLLLPVFPRLHAVLLLRREATRTSTKVTYTYYFHHTVTDPSLLGTRQAALPGGLRTGAPGKHVVKGKAKYRLVDEKVRYFVAPPIEDIVASPVRILRLHVVPYELTPYPVTSLREHTGETELRAKTRNIWEASSRWPYRRTLLPYRSKSW